MVRQKGLARAEELYQAADYAAAAAMLDAERAASPTNPTILRLLGLCRLRLGDADRALDVLRQAVGLAPSDPLAGLHYGIGLQAVGRHAEAVDWFRAAQTTLPLNPAPWLNMATSLLALGDAPGALRAARRARLRAPRMAETHYTVGLAHMAEANLSAAGAAFAEATRRSPNFAEAWVSLGLIRYRGDDLRGAVAAMRQALAIDPDNRAATVNLAVFLRLLGDGEQSEQILGALLTRDPDAAQARVNLADVMLQDSRPAAALALLDHPIPGSRALRQHWMLQQALCLLNLGRAGEARDAIDALGPVAPAARPLLLWRRVLLAAAAGAAAEAGALAADMEAAIADGATILPEHRIMVYFDLASFWDRRGETDRAFRCWQRGHDVLARAQPLDRAGFAAFIDASMTHFDNHRFRNGPRASNADKRPVFIVGMPRSGSRLTEQILAAHRDVAACGERTALAEMVAALGGATDTGSAVARIARLDGARLDHAAQAYLADLRSAAPEAARIVDKMPGNFRYLGLVALMLPGAHHSLRARPARYRHVDLHPQILRRASLCTQSGRPGLVYWTATAIDGALARGSADADPDCRSARLGGRFPGDAATRSDVSRIAIRFVIRTVLRIRAPRAHRQPRAGARTDQRARPRALAPLCGAAGSADRCAGGARRFRRRHALTIFRRVLASREPVTISWPETRHRRPCPTKP
jgi:tetratricopeptide (TPR) repeat protein